MAARPCITASAAFLLLSASAAAAAEPAKPAAEAGREGIEFFERRIRPVLVERCYKCHSAGAEKLKGNLRLDTREDVRKGGGRGSAIVPGDPDRSLLIQAIRYTDEELKMPPGRRLSTEQVADFETWVRSGAPQPGEKTATEPAAFSA